MKCFQTLIEERLLLDHVQPILDYNSINLIYFYEDFKINRCSDKFKIDHSIHKILFHCCAIMENLIIKIGQHNTVGTIFVAMHFYKKRANFCMFKYNSINKFFEEFYISDPKLLKLAHSILKMLDRLSYTSIYKNILYKNCIKYDLLVKRLVNLY